MRGAIKGLLFAVLFSAAAFAGDSVREFAFTTADGKSVVFKAGSGAAMVVKICSPW